MEVRASGWKPRRHKRSHLRFERGRTESRRPANTGGTHSSTVQSKITPTAPHRASPPRVSFQPALSRPQASVLQNASYQSAAPQSTASQSVLTQPSFIQSGTPIQRSTSTTTRPRKPGKHPHPLLPPKHRSCRRSARVPPDSDGEDSSSQTGSSRQTGTF